MASELSAYPNHYIAQRLLLPFVQRPFVFYDASGDQRFFVRPQDLRLRDVIPVYADQTCTQECLTLLARTWGDAPQTYDVLDTRERAVVGSAQRLTQDAPLSEGWTLFDRSGHGEGSLKEQTSRPAFWRLLLPLWTQTHILTWNHQHVGEVRQRLGLLRVICDVDFSQSSNDFDLRLGVGAAILLLSSTGAEPVIWPRLPQEAQKPV